MRIQLVSMLSENTGSFIRGLAGYLSARTGLDVRTVDAPPWQERQRMLDRGEAQVGFFCGLHYVRRVRCGDPPLELLAAPVMAGARYGGRPVYFSEVLVRRDSPYRGFRDLRGASWAYNEPLSHSGFSLVRSHLARLGETRGFFGRVVESGSHLESLRLLLAGEVCGSAVDGTVLDLELRSRPRLAGELRSVATLGPSTIPPAVVRRDVPRPARARLREALLGMHGDPAGRRLLASALMARFAAVRDDDYDDIRLMALAGEAVSLGPRCGMTDSGRWMAGGG